MAVNYLRLFTSVRMGRMGLNGHWLVTGSTQGNSIEIVFFALHEWFPIGIRRAIVISCERFDWLVYKYRVDLTRCKMCKMGKKRWNMVKDKTETGR